MKNILIVLLLLFLAVQTKSQTLTCQPIEYWTFDNCANGSVNPNDKLAGTSTAAIPLVYELNTAANYPSIFSNVRVENWKGGNGNYVIIEEGNGDFRSDTIFNKVSSPYNRFYNFSIEFLLQLHNLNGNNEGGKYGSFELMMLNNQNIGFYFQLLSIFRDSIKIGNNIYL